MVGQMSALDLLVANLAMHFHRSADPHTLLNTTPRHAAIDRVQGFNPIGLALAQLGEIELILL
jgi:ABC-type enterochelin transport system permease subunit